MSQWYCKLSGAAAGPFSRDELDYLVVRGQLHAETEVRLEQDRVWSPAAERLADLFPTPKAGTHAAAAPGSVATTAVTVPRPVPPATTARTRQNVLLGSAIGVAAAALIFLLLVLLLTYSRLPGGGGVAANGGRGQAVGRGGGNAAARAGELADGPAAPTPATEPQQSAAAAPAAEPAAASDSAGGLAARASQAAGATSAADAPEPLESAQPPQFSIARLPDPPAAASDPADSRNAPPAGERPDVRKGLAGRAKGKKEELLKEFGGTATTEESVELGLAWLVKHQAADGGWALRGAFQNPGSIESRVAATAMALLAFQGAGHTHRDGKYAEVVARGWEYLLTQQQPDGAFNSRDHFPLYAHAQATIALCELYGMTHDEKFRSPAQQAVKFCCEAQADDGGWRYTPRMAGDLSVTGWFVMALQSARMAELDVPDAVFEKVDQFLDACTADGGATYAYLPGKAATPAMTAEGLLCRQYLGWKRSDPRLVQGVQALLMNPINRKSKEVYYWYYATQVCHHMEGPAWDRWNKVMRVEIPKLQERSGPEKGSWSPAGDHHGQTAGRLYETCLALYMLEVYYRHLPIYRFQSR